MSYNLLGYLPAPTVYGLIYDAGTGGNSRHAMATLMFTPVISLLFLGAGGYLIVRDDVLKYSLHEEERERLERGSEFASEIERHNS